MSPSRPVPVLLLKTRSSPHDGYQDLFSATAEYTPTFIPVLEHRYNGPNLGQVRDLILSGAFADGDAGQRRRYGGIVFTSQRAVEGFAKMMHEDVGVSSAPLILYSVGPATYRALATLRDSHLPSAEVIGRDAGTGEKLAHQILEHYNRIYLGAQSLTSPSASTSPSLSKPSLLFLAGEVHRDVIPKTLSSHSLPEEQRIHVDELVVYETGVMASFEDEFSQAIQAATAPLTGGDEGERVGKAVTWIVVFSPTGTDAMLRTLEKYGNAPIPIESGPASQGQDIGPGQGQEQSHQDRSCFVATIGPTTRDHLRTKHGVVADVCAEEPSPEGVARGIQEFMRRNFY